MAQLDGRFVGPLEGETVDKIIQDALVEPGQPEGTPEPDPFICSNGPVLSVRFSNPGGTWFDDYVADEGYVAARKVLTSMTPEQVIDEVSKPNLRGLGGAGFRPAGSGPSSPRTRPSRSSSWSTRTRVSPAPSRTATSWSGTRTTSLKA